MKKILIATALIALSFSAFTQVKLGHINSSDLVRLMPELDTAEQALSAYIREIQVDMQTMQTELENKYNEYQANQNQWSDLIKQTRMRALQDLQARLQEYEQTAQKDAEEQRAKLFTPIFDKAKEAINAVAKEHKYTYIFDTGGGALIFFNDSDDITDLVKKKLGLK